MKYYTVIENQNSTYKRKFTIEITTRYNIFGWKIEKVVPYRVGISVEPHVTQIRRFKTEAKAQNYIDCWLVKSCLHEENSHA